MPNKSNVSSRASKKNGFRFRWWMGLILVVIVGGVGIVVLRFSQAGGTVYTMYLGTKSGECFPNSTLYDQGNARLGKLCASSFNAGVVNGWTFTFTNNTYLPGCLKTANSKNVTSSQLQNGAGPYNFITKSSQTSCI